MNKVWYQSVAMSLGLGLAATVLAGPVNDAAAVRDALRERGHGEVRDVEHDDGLWEAEVRGEDGRWYDLHVVPETGEVLDPRSGELMTADAIQAGLEADGYTRIHDLDLDGAIWEVEATAADGGRVELKLSAFDGRVLAMDIDD